MPKDDNERRGHHHREDCDDDDRDDARAVKLLGKIHEELEAIHGIQTAILLKMSSGATGRRAAGFGFTVGQATNKKKDRQMLNVKITNEQQIPITIAPQTDSGKPAKIDGKPSVTQLSGTASFVQSDDGLTLLLISGVDPGVSEFMVKADANLAQPDAPNPDTGAEGNQNYEEISDVITLTVEGATAKNLGLVAGTPENKPDVAPPAPAAARSRR